MSLLAQSQTQQGSAIRVVPSIPSQRSAKGFFLTTTPGSISQAQAAPSSAQPPTQVSLTQRYAQAKSELQHIYQQGRLQQPHTLAEQAVFVQSYRSVVEGVEVFYQQATGQMEREAEHQLQQRYLQMRELLKVFYGQAHQPPDAWKQSQRMIFDIYVQAQNAQPQGMKMSLPPVTPSVPSLAKNPPSMVPSSVTPQARPAQPDPSMVSSSQDQKTCRPWSPEELKTLQQAKTQVLTPPQGRAAPQGKLAQKEQLAQPTRLPQTAYWVPPVQSSQAVQPIQPRSSSADPMILPSNGQPFSGKMVPAQNPASTSMVSVHPVQPNHQVNTPQAQQPRYQRDRQSWDPKVSRRDYLIRERTHLEREIERVLGLTDALNQRWHLLDEKKAQLAQEKILVPAKEAVSFIVRHVIRLPLPSAARSAAYRQERLRQEEVWQQQQAISLNAHYNALRREIALIETELEMLQF